MVTATRTKPPQKFARLESVDLLRGLLMILMALDHTRDFFTYLTIDPTNPTQSWPLLFITRWVTHLCAPGFILLAGTSIYLQVLRGKSHPALTRLLLTRGLWLIVLELTLINFAWSFNLRIPVLQVFWVIGIAMILFAPQLKLPLPFIAALGLVLIFGHNLLDGIRANTLGNYANLRFVLHQPGMIDFRGLPIAFVAYPLIPWIAVLPLGYCFGAFITQVRHPRLRTLQIGMACLALFALLRLTGVRYGDARPCSILQPHQPRLCPSSPSTNIHPRSITSWRPSAPSSSSGLSPTTQSSANGLHASAASLRFMAEFPSSTISSMFCCCTALSSSLPLRSMRIGVIGQLPAPYSPFTFKVGDTVYLSFT
jgi:uncharacterized membrane protein